MSTSVGMSTSVAIERARAFVDAQNRLSEPSSDGERKDSDNLQDVADQSFVYLQDALGNTSSDEIDSNQYLKKLEQLVQNRTADKQQISSDILQQVINPCYANKGTDRVAKTIVSISSQIKKIGLLGNHKFKENIALTCKKFSKDMFKSTRLVTGLKLEIGDVSSTDSLIGLLKAYPNLRELNLSAVGRFVDDRVLKEVANFNHLSRLCLEYCGLVRDLDLLAGLTELTSLNLEGCWGITDLGPLAGLTELTSLNLDGCRQITNLGPLAGLTELTSLNLEGCRTINNLSPLRYMTQMRDLDLRGCWGITDLGPLAGLTELRGLYFRGCEQITDLGPLAGLTQMRDLYLKGCEQITDLGPLEGMTKLTSLNLVYCYQITDLGPLEGMTKLTSLYLDYCGTTDADIAAFRAAHPYLQIIC